VPDSANPGDPNYNTPWDYYEFSWDGTVFGGDTDNVDGFGVPIQQDVVKGSSDQETGIKENHAQVIAGYRSAVSQAFQSLVSGSGDATRILSPIKSSDWNNAGGQEAHYLDQAIDEFWNYYTTHTFTYQCNNVTFTGQVVDGELQFTTDREMVPGEGTGPFTISKPTTTDVVQVNGPLITPGPNEATHNKIGAVVGASILRGVGTDNAAWGDSSEYYDDPTEPGMGSPYLYSEYAKYMHSIGIGGMAYAFSTDDQSDQSTYVSAQDPDSVTLTIDY
jgi:hypothetical protein